MVRSCAYVVVVLLVMVRQGVRLPFRDPCARLIMWGKLLSRIIDQTLLNFNNLTEGTMRKWLESLILSGKL